MADKRKAERHWWPVVLVVKGSSVSVAKAGGKVAHKKRPDRLERLSGNKCE